MSFLWIAVAFSFGFVARQIGLPPLVGYLAAGFVLNAYGFTADAALETLADLGITLMLFTIGLKVNVRQLIKPEILGGTLVHMGTWHLLMLPLFSLLATWGIHQLFNLDLATSALVLFAFSFSSTVCAIKVLEESAELKTRHSDIAIGVLIIQDLIAVAFLFVATGKTPSVWAFALLLLLFVRPLMQRLFDSSGHGELVPLLGFLLAFGGPELFKLTGMKGDLGALAMGMVIAGLPKANELYKSLIGFKDLFLIGFFLSIGFTALPTLEMWLISLALIALLPLKLLLFFGIFLMFAARARTAFLGALLLANFSEFGLIVASLSVDEGWVSAEWLVIIAMSTAMSFVFSSFVYKYAHPLYAHFKDQLVGLQREKATRINRQECPEKAEVLIVGMGRVGTGAYESLAEEMGDRVWGVDVDTERAKKFKEQGWHVIAGDADDIEFWESMRLDRLKLVMLAIPSVNEMKNILYQLQHTDFRGKIAAIAHYEDERQELMELGVDVAFNYFTEVGAGFAEESRHLLRV
ncbi:MAG: cation:proton antiporter family protein [Oleiphilaceae bacterium]|nr:cation:proton antiporter family protein [Oleiphilaceae bacterium]